ncbi:hypothetical protein SmJEL517_g01664 [Synchytrium microbalum]|uniref:ELMO domain-containing protein n=1 Tax=Synchytrium microbalum TaxID=1806994 RepID=A0A507C9V7_9FUNG|nr:uncharacterized protein SmJEL517_g01664 [Synchytrium microbalum]TPX36261.1 hypothetical protein SmJEL517_g01664 [Synchytrium microbalum]
MGKGSWSWWKTGQEVCANVEVNIDTAENSKDGKFLAVETPKETPSFWSRTTTILASIFKPLSPWTHSTEAAVASEVQWDIPTIVVPLPQLDESRATPKFFSKRSRIFQLLDKILHKSHDSHAVVSPKLIYELDRAIRLSKELKPEKKELQRRGSTEVVMYGLVNKKVIPATGVAGFTGPHVLILEAIVGEIGCTYALQRELERRAATPYDSTVLSSELKLLDLWDLLMPNSPLTDRKTKRWQEIGFQGCDPATDFRAMGMLGLDDLHYYASQYPVSAAKVLAISNDKDRWFSFALAGIMVSQFVLHLVKSGQLQPMFFSFGADIGIYHEMYRNISIMDFERLFGIYKANIEKQLAELQDSILDMDMDTLLNVAPTRPDMSSKK